MPGDLIGVGDHDVRHHGFVHAEPVRAQAAAVLAAVTNWTATRNGGSGLTSHHMAEALSGLGLQDVRQIPTVPGGPVLVAGRRPQAAASAS